MPTALDLLYVAVFAALLPVLDYLFFWPSLHHRLRADPVKARRWLYAWGIGSPWLLVAAGAAIWLSAQRPWAAMGFTCPTGWRLWAASSLLLLLGTYAVYSVTTLLRSPQARASARAQIGELPDIAPHSRTELYWFGGAALTAGFCEEFLFRGYFIWALSPWLGWWGAAGLSLLVFGLGHIYQGRSGAVRSGLVGLLFTLAFAILESLWPPIVLHAMLDLKPGAVGWLAHRDRAA